LIDRSPLPGTGDARELIIVLPQGDPGRAWQTNAGAVRPEPWQLAAGIVGNTPAAATAIVGNVLVNAAK